ncbi:MAG: cytochrome c4 [Betaproteobacteria bacterium]|nr:cytochrome c4 [Betaproteobacteria bacterium]
MKTIQKAGTGTFRATRRIACWAAGSVLASAAFVSGSAVAEDVTTKVAACIACHGEDGNSTIPDNPDRAGQSARYIYLQLRDYKEGRLNPIMSAIASGDGQAGYVGSRQLLQLQEAEAERLQGGCRQGDARQEGGRRCALSHVPPGRIFGQNEVPRVAGQHQAYIYKQLMAFKTKERNNYADMNAYIKNIPEADIEALSHYIANLN